jgi:hypothetical protein
MLAGASFEEPDQPLQAIDAIFQSLEDAPLERVFQGWMDRLEQCCVAVGVLVEIKSNDDQGFTRSVSRYESARPTPYTMRGFTTLHV